MLQSFTQLNAQNASLNGKFCAFEVIFTLNLFVSFHLASYQSTQNYYKIIISKLRYSEKFAYKRNPEWSWLDLHKHFCVQSQVQFVALAHTSTNLSQLNVV